MYYLQWVGDSRQGANGGHYPCRIKKIMFPSMAPVLQLNTFLVVKCSATETITDWFLWHDQKQILFSTFMVLFKQWFQICINAGPKFSSAILQIRASNGSLALRLSYPNKELLAFLQAFVLWPHVLKVILNNV